MDNTYNGWANWETWCASLWINNDEALYRTARVYGHSGYDRLVTLICSSSVTIILTDCTGKMMQIDREEMDEMLKELCEC